MASINPDHLLSEGLGPIGRSCLSAMSGLAGLEGHFVERRSFRALRELSDDQLKDIGRSRFEADREAAAWS